MRSFFFLLPLLLLTACAGDSPASETAAAAATTQLTTPSGQDLPADQMMTGDAAVDSVISRYAYLADRFETGMLQRKDVVYQCDNITGRVELYTDKGEFALAINHYNDGTQRTVTDRWYYDGGDQPVYLSSESITWEIEGPMVKNPNGTETPGVRTSNAQYRYYIADGEVFKFLKKRWEHYNYRTDNVAAEDVANEEAPTTGEIPSRIKIITSARERAEVDCAAFQ